MTPSQLRSSPLVSSKNAKRELNGASFTPTTLQLISLGTIGGLLFALSYVIEGITQPGYNVWQHSISLPNTCCNKSLFFL